MSKTFDEYPKISAEFQKRVLEFIGDEDFDGKECTSPEFAKRVGVSKTVISNITKYGIVPSVRSLIRIADYLNISLEYLLCLADDLSFTKSESGATFHERLDELIKEGQLKRADVTNGGSFPRNSIQVWNARKNLPTLNYLLELSNIFEVSPDYLLGRTDYRN